MAKKCCGKWKKKGKFCSKCPLTDEQRVVVLDKVKKVKKAKKAKKAKK